MHLLYGQDAVVAAWAATQSPAVHGDYGQCAAIGILSEPTEDAPAGRPLGAVIFNNHRVLCRDIHVHVASAGTRRWLTRPIITKIMSYPFVQLDCARVTAVTPRRATSARKFIEDFGFKREGLIRRGFGDDDAVIYGLLKGEWLRSKWAAPRKPPGAPRGQGSTASTDPAGSERGGGSADAVEPADRALPEPAQ